MGYNRPGTSDFTGAIANNPGVSLTANRNPRSAISARPDRSSSAIARIVGPPANMPTTRVYPMSDVITGDITVFEPGLQVPYGMTWTGGWQRKVGSSMVVEARYVGSRSLQSWQTYNYNEINIVENGFLNEFRARAAEPGGEHRRGPRQHVQPTPARRGPRRCRSSWRTSRGCRRRLRATPPATRRQRQLDEHHVPRLPGEVQPDAVQLCQHR